MLKIRLETLGLPCLLWLAGCASFMIRQECKKVNWFEHGKSVAEQGRRLEGDDQIKKCKQADFELDDAEVDRGFKAGLAAYCQPEQALLTGRRGYVFNPDFCETRELTKLRKKYDEGIRQYCKPSNGFHIGSQGLPLNPVCPDDLQEEFTQQHRKGRAKYLRAQSDSKQQQARTARNEVRNLERQQARLKHEMAPLQRIVERERRYRTDTNANPSANEIRLNDLQDQYSSISRRLSDLSGSAAQLENEAARLRAEADSLD